MKRWLAQKAPLFAASYSTVWMIELALGVQFPWWDQMFLPAIVIGLSFAVSHQRRRVRIQQAKIDYQASTIENQIETISQLNLMLGHAGRWN